MSSNCEVGQFAVQKTFLDCKLTMKSPGTKILTVQATPMIRLLQLDYHPQFTPEP
jgi:hypothetical protein